MLKFVEQYWLPLTMVSLALITLGSLAPLPALPEVPGTDKTHHLLAYAVLMFPAAWRRPSGWICLALLFATWSGVIELLQPHVNRYGEWLDFFANCAGLLMGIGLAWLINLFVTQKNR